jgi:hypothetical protein
MNTGRRSKARTHANLELLFARASRSRRRNLLQDIYDEIDRTRLQSELTAARNRAEDLEWRRGESEEQRQRRRGEEMRRQQTWWQIPFTMPYAQPPSAAY